MSVIKEFLKEEMSCGVEKPSVLIALNTEELNAVDPNIAGKGTDGAEMSARRCKSGKQIILLQLSGLGQIYAEIRIPWFQLNGLMVPG